MLSHHFPGVNHTTVGSLQYVHWLQYVKTAKKIVDNPDAYGW